MVVVVESTFVHQVCVGIDNNMEKKRCEKHISITNTRNYVKNSNRKKTKESHLNSLLSERLQGRRRESTELLCIMALTIEYCFITLKP